MDSNRNQLRDNNGDWIYLPTLYLQFKPFYGLVCEESSLMVTLKEKENSQVRGDSDILIIL